MINWRLLAPQAEALALHIALQQAETGIVRWSGALAREHNEHWLAKNIPDRLAMSREIVEDGRCECGGVCLILAADEMGLYHRCTACRAVYRVAWSEYHK